MAGIPRRRTKSYVCSAVSLCNPTDCSPPGSTVHGISQARILEQFAISSSKGSSQPRYQNYIFPESPALAGGCFSISPTWDNSFSDFFPSRLLEIIEQSSLCYEQVLVSCLFYIQRCTVLVVQSCPIPCDTMDCSPPGSQVCVESPGKNTRLDYHALFQGIFTTQGSNPGLPHCRRILYHLSHQGSPRILEWEYPLPGYLPDPGIKPGSPALQADSLPAELQGSPILSVEIFYTLFRNTEIKYSK